MILILFVLAVAGTALYRTSTGGTLDRVARFKNKYLPVEADIGDHIARNTPFGFVQGHNPGRVEHKNPMPLIAVNEFRYKLNETGWGFPAGGTKSPAVNTANYQKRIDMHFNIEEHPLFDVTRMDFMKGRHRRRQYAFIDPEE